MRAAFPRISARARRLGGRRAEPEEPQCKACCRCFPRGGMRARERVCVPEVAPVNNGVIPGAGQCWRFTGIAPQNNQTLYGQNNQMVVRFTTTSEAKSEKNRKNRKNTRYFPGIPGFSQVKLTLGRPPARCAAHPGAQEAAPAAPRPPRRRPRHGRAVRAVHRRIPIPVVCGSAACARAGLLWDGTPPLVVQHVPPPPIRVAVVLDLVHDPSVQDASKPPHFDRRKVSHSRPPQTESS